MNRAYMDRLQKEVAKRHPQIRTFFSSGPMVDPVLHIGMPAARLLVHGKRNRQATTVYSAETAK